MFPIITNENLIKTFKSSLHLGTSSPFPVVAGLSIAVAIQ